MLSDQTTVFHAAKIVKRFHNAKAMFLEVLYEQVKVECWLVLITALNRHMQLIQID